MPGYKGTPSLEDLKKQRQAVFDRWNWETNSDEDAKELEILDEKIKFLEEHGEEGAGFFYCPYIPVTITNINDD